MGQAKKRQSAMCASSSKDLLGVISANDPFTSIVYVKNLPLVLYEDALEDFFNQVRC